MPEREIDEEDTETAELQTNLRRCQLNTRSEEEQEEPEELRERKEERRQRRAGSNPEREIFTADTETAEFQSNLRKLTTFSQSAGVVSEVPGPEVDKRTSSNSSPSRSNKTVFRPAMRCQKSLGLRRSRTWEGFSSGLRYESVSDAGLPPPPSAPPAPGNR